MFELRHKTRPIPVCVNLSEGGDFKIEVNSGFPVMDVIPSICQEIGELRRHRDKEHKMAKVFYFSMQKNEKKILGGKIKILFGGMKD